MAKRQRLSSDEARRKILEAAQKCLIEQGVNGLRIANVAAEANIVHSSILHHFGSADGLRQALAKHLSVSIFEEITTALSSASDEDIALSVITKLFDALGPGGHANLIAWLLIAGPDYDNQLANVQDEYTRLFSQVIELVRDNLSRIRNQEVTVDEARFTVHLVLIAACGQGIIGESVSDSLDMEDRTQDFLQWFANRIRGNQSE